MSKESKEPTLREMMRADREVKLRLQGDARDKLLNVLTAPQAKKQGKTTVIEK